MPATSRTAANTATWDQPVLAPVVLVRGPEALFRERAVEGLVALARERDPETERVTLDGGEYTTGGLMVATSPSLFGEVKIVVVTGAEAGTDDLYGDLISYVAHPDPHTPVVIVHGGGVKGKKMLDTVIKSGAPVVVCDELKRDDQKAGFVQRELRAAGRRAAPEAVQALVYALGSNLSELAAGITQLVADTTGTISAVAVDRYYGGRVEATGFKVADAAVAGHAGEAVALLRHALATGQDPVPIVAALAYRLRTLAKAAAVRSGLVSARESGVNDWQLRNLQTDLRRWSPAALGAAISAVAAADAEVKGASRDPVYAVEKAVLAIANAVAV